MALKRSPGKVNLFHISCMGRTHDRTTMARPATKVRFVLWQRKRLGQFHPPSQRLQCQQKESKCLRVYGEVSSHALRLYTGDLAARCCRPSAVVYRPVRRAWEGANLY